MSLIRDFRQVVSCEQHCIIIMLQYIGSSILHFYKKAAKSRTLTQHNPGLMQRSRLDRSVMPHVTYFCKSDTVDDQKGSFYFEINVRDNYL
jgi:hypothetical protein